MGPMIAIAIGVVVGVAITVSAGELFVPWFMERLDAEFEKAALQPLPDEPAMTREAWLGVTAGRPGGLFVGRAERLVFFGALVAQGWVLVVAWLAFKLAVNWQSLQSDYPRYFNVRMLCGTAANLAVAMAGAGIARWIGWP
jgi:hypothetical protein